MPEGVSRKSLNQFSSYDENFETFRIPGEIAVGYALYQTLGPSVSLVTPSIEILHWPINVSIALPLTIHSSNMTHLTMLRQWTGKKQPANMITTATSILAAFRLVRSWPIVLELAGGQGFRRSARKWKLVGYCLSSERWENESEFVILIQISCHGTLKVDVML